MEASQPSSEYTRLKQPPLKNPEKVMDYILRGIDINLWAQAKQKATVERKSMREVLFEGIKWYVTPAEIPTTPQKKKGKKKG